MTLANKNIMDPALLDVLAAFKLDVFRTINAIKPGVVQSFDAARKTVVVKILFKRVLPTGTVSEYPVLVDVPVFTLQGGGGHLQFPIAAGDQGLLLFSDRNIDAWFSTGSAAPPNDARAHDLSDAFFLCGVNSLASSMPAYDANVNLAIPSGKKLVITGGAEIDALGTQMLALKADVDNLLTFVNTLITTFNAHVHTGVTSGSGSSGVPATPFAGTPPTIVGTTKLLGS